MRTHASILLALCSTMAASVVSAGVDPATPEIDPPSIEGPSGWDPETGLYVLALAEDTAPELRDTVLPGTHRMAAD